MPLIVQQLYYSASTDPSDVSLEAVCTMYLLRLGIEHFFRFAKRRMGLPIAQIPDLVAAQNWVWIITLAYTQLLLARHLVTAQPRPWDPTPRRDPQQPLTPGQVRQAWPVFSHGLGTPAHPPRPAACLPPACCEGGRQAGKIARTRCRIPSQASATLPGGHQEAKTAICGLETAP